MLIQLLGNFPHKVLNYEQSEKTLNVVLLQNGIYAAQTIVNSSSSFKCYALESDWLASGLPLLNDVSLISAQQWVGLCAQYHPVITIQS